MNDLDQLEVDLQRLEPRRPSVAFKQSVLKELRDRPASASKRWPVWAAGALAAACLAAMMLWSNGPIHQLPRGVGSQPGEHLAIEPLDPTVLAYRRVLNRAPQELNALLDRQNAFTLPPSAREGPTRAFHRTDIDLYR